MTHDFERHGTTTLVVAVNVLGARWSAATCNTTVTGNSSACLRAVERGIPAGKVIYATLDNDAAHKHPRVRVRNQFRLLFATAARTGGAFRQRPQAACLDTLQRQGVHAVSNRSTVFKIAFRFAEFAAGQKFEVARLYSTWKTALPASTKGLSMPHSLYC